MESYVHGDPLEGFVSLVREAIEHADEKAREVASVADKLVEYVREDPFRDYTMFYSLLYRLDSLCSEMIEYLQTVEVRLEELRLRAGVAERDGGETAQQAEEIKRSIIDRILRRKPKQEGKVKAGGSRTGIPTVEYGRRLIERIDHLMNQYMFHYYLVQAQDGGERSLRWMHSKMQLMVAVSDLASDIKKYAIAAIEHRRLRLEAELQELASALLRGESAVGGGTG